MAIESFVVFLIAIAPFVFLIYAFVYAHGHDDVEGSSIFGHTLKSIGYTDIGTYLWVLLGKVLALYLFMIWFFTCKQWWYHIILIPVSMYSFQVVEMVCYPGNTMDSTIIWWLLPISLAVVPSVYLIKLRLYDKYVNRIDLDAIDAEIKRLEQKNPYLARTDLREAEKVPDNIEYLSFLDKVDVLLSTHNLEHQFRQLQHFVRNRTRGFSTWAKNGWNGDVRPF